MFLEDKGTGSKETVESADSVLGASKKLLKPSKIMLLMLKM
jgi:hypothetical protein